MLACISNVVIGVEGVVDVWGNVVAGPWGNQEQLPHRMFTPSKYKHPQPPARPMHFAVCLVHCNLSQSFKTYHMGLRLLVMIMSLGGSSLAVGYDTIP